MVRNAAFRRVEIAARRSAQALAEIEMAGGMSEEAWSQLLEGYYSVHESIGTGPGARSAEWFSIEDLGERWLVRQVFDDPQGFHDMALQATIDLAASNETGSPAWCTLGLQSG
jgi:hypothetical protein